LFSVAMAFLTVAIIGAIHARGPARPFWSGFAIGGWMYLLLQYGPFCESQVGPYTFPSAVLDLLHAAIAPTPVQPPPTQGGMMQMMRGMMGSGSTMQNVSAPGTSPAPSVWLGYAEPNWGPGRYWNGPQASHTFFRIGHSLLCLITALAAGLLARWFATRPRVDAAVRA
jgi:hypothetical protein